MPRIDLSQLPNLRSPKLHALWRKTFNSAPPTGAKCAFLARLLAHELQQRATGALPRVIAKQLAMHVPGAATLESEATSAQSLRLGARLVRTWKGKTHEITVVERGFVYRGHRYRSLTEIAEAITGTHWSGPRFFGLRNRRAHADSAQECS
jgi:hypothetical protein